MTIADQRGFYSSPSCDGDPASVCIFSRGRVSILPRLATGINTVYRSAGCICFYSSPSCDGDRYDPLKIRYLYVSILPRLATGIILYNAMYRLYSVSILPRLATGIYFPYTHKNQLRFYSSPSCDGDPAD